MARHAQDSRRPHARGRMVAFDQMGLQICDDHVRGRQIVVAHPGWLDHQQFAAGHTRRHIARGPDHQRVPGRWSCRSATSPRMRCTTSRISASMLTVGPHPGCCAPGGGDPDGASPSSRPPAVVVQGPVFGAQLVVGGDIFLNRGVDVLLGAVGHPHHQRAARKRTEVDPDDECSCRVCGYPSAPRNHLEALAARRLLKMSKATANSKTKPLMNDWTSVPRPSSDMPLLRTPMIRPPIKAPVTVPMPPVTAAPPMKTAAMASSSKPVPAPGSAELLRAVNVIPAMAARKPMLTKSQKSTLLVFTPDSCAASRLPPRAYTCLPKTLRFITVE